jgi:hypothetical protein
VAPLFRVFLSKNGVFKVLTFEDLTFLESTFGYVVGYVVHRPLPERLTFLDSVASVPSLLPLFL